MKCYFLILFMFFFIDNIQLLNKFEPGSVMSVYDIPLPMNNSEKFYQGSILFNFPSDKNFPAEKVNLKVINNFLFTNSSVSQYITGQNGITNITKDKNEKEEVGINNEKLKELQENLILMKIKLEKMNELNKGEKNKISSLEDQIKNKNKEIENIKNSYDNKINQMVVETKKEKEEDYVLLNTTIKKVENLTNEINNLKSNCVKNSLLLSKSKNSIYN